MPIDFLRFPKLNFFHSDKNISLPYTHTYFSRNEKVVIPERILCLKIHRPHIFDYSNETTNIFQLPLTRTLEL